MRTIYCLTEKESDELDDIIKKYDEDSMIHLYSHIIDSYNGDMTRCIMDLYYCGIDTDECMVVTDVKELYDVLIQYFKALFEDVIYIDDGNNRFENGFDKKLFIDNLAGSNSEKLEDRFISTYIEIKNINDFAVFNDFSGAIYEQINNTHKLAEQLCCIAKIMVDLAKNKKISVSNELMIYSLSLIMRSDKNAENTNAFLEFFLSCGYLEHEDIYYFVWNQMKAYRLKKRIVTDNHSQELLDVIYKKAYDISYKKITDKLKKIPSNERDNNAVLVYTIQYLGGNHAPSKTVRERIKKFKKMGKKVYFINTCEQYKEYGYLPMYLPIFGRIDESLYKEDEIDIDGNEFWFRQLSDMKGIVNTMDSLIEYIEKIRPYYILSIGTGSILADLSSNIVPTVSMALAFSTLPHTEKCIKVLGRNLTEEEKKINTDDIVESRFTFELKPQQVHLRRDEFEISKDAFVIVVVGIRLDYEITDEFIKVLDKVCRRGAYVVFAGIFEKYADKVSGYKNIKDNSKFIGYCEDMLALMDICDLYVNPKRLGGGFSVIEAFAKGVPGVYVKEGDVYTAGGDDFAVDDYNEMTDTIIKYMEDKEFYKAQVKKAKERAKLMTSSESALMDMDNKICKLIEEKYW